MVENQSRVLMIGVDQALLGLIEKFMAEDLLPNISKLVKNGVIGEALPCPPCDTPTNWATIATGATTGKHGATSFYSHIPGEELDEGLKHRSRTQLSRYGQAEYVWNIAEKYGKNPFVINYPAGWPANFEKGAMSLYKWSVPESAPRIIKNGKSRVFEKESKKKTAIISSVEDVQALNLESKVNPLSIKLFKAPNTQNPDNFAEAYIISKEDGYDSVAIKGTNSNWVFSSLNDWSDWVHIPCKKKDTEYDCIYRVCLEEINPDGSTARVRYSNIYNTKGWAVPDGIGEELIKNAFADELSLKSPEVEYMIDGDVETFLIDAKKEADTIAHAIKFMKDKIDWKLCMFHIHYLDSVNHYFLSYLYEKSPLRKENPDLSEVAEENVKVAYQIVDNLVGQLVESCVDEKTTVIFVADHGAIPSWKNFNLAQALVSAGLLSYKWKKNQYVVDWSKTRAFPYFEPPYIWVNLEERDPHGIVPKSEYEKTCKEIINVLDSLRDPETNEKIVRVAFTQKEAAFLGQIGERIGDVIFFLNPPYQLFDGSPSQLNASTQPAELMSLPLTYKSNICYGAHAYYLPRTEVGIFSVSSPIILSGARIDNTKKLFTPVNLTDITPTICEILGIPRPKTAQGRLLHEILK